MFRAIRNFFDLNIILIITCSTVTGLIIVLGVGISYGLGYAAAEYNWRQHNTNIKKEYEKREALFEKRDEIKEHLTKARIEYLESELVAARTNYDKDHDALVRLAEELKRERQLLTLVNDYLKDVDPDALENLRKGVQ